MISDMTKGNPLKLILSFSVPMLIGNIFQQVYNFVDAAIVGKFVGAESLAAVGSTGTIVGVMICLMMGLTSGAGIIIAQCFGSRNFDELRKTVTGLIYIVGILAVVTSVAGVVFSRPILSFLNTPDNVIDEAVAYINVIFAFTIGTAMYNASSAIQEGDTSVAGLSESAHENSADLRIRAKISIAVGVADPSIAWGEGRVQVVAMVAFSESDREAFQTVFEQLVEVFSERDSVQRIVRRGTTFPAFLDELVAVVDG